MGEETYADAVGVSLFALFLFFILYILYYISLCLGVPNERSLKCIDTKRTTLSGRNCAYVGRGRRGAEQQIMETMDHEPNANRNKIL